MTMSIKMQQLAKAAFQQGIVDEDNNRPSPARLRIDSRVRHFYDAARKQRYDQLYPQRKAKEDERLAQIQEIERKARLRLESAIPAIKLELEKQNFDAAIRLVLNAQIGI